MNDFEYVLLVDDDDVTNFINNVILLRAGCSIKIKIFNSPLNALRFLEENLETGHNRILIFLDINMPVMTGWNFLNHIQEKRMNFNSLQIHILSSSNYFVDQNKADEHPLVKSFISKPLTIEKVQEMLF